MVVTRVCVCVCARAHACARARLCLTLCDPMDYRPLVSPLSMGFSRQEHWSGLPVPTPGDLPDPGIEPTSPALAGILYHWATWEVGHQNSAQIPRWHFLLGALLWSPFCLLVLESVISWSALVSDATVKRNNQISITNPAQHLSRAEERRPMAIWSGTLSGLWLHYFSTQWTRGQIRAHLVFRQRDQQVTTLGETASIFPGWNGFVWEGSLRGNVGVKTRMEEAAASNLNPPTNSGFWRLLSPSQYTIWIWRL